MSHGCRSSETSVAEKLKGSSASLMVGGKISLGIQYSWNGDADHNQALQIHTLVVDDQICSSSSGFTNGKSMLT